MAGKFTLFVGFGAGYVLGARAGRERYDQVAGKAKELWRDPRVQEKAAQAKQVAKDKTDLAQHLVQKKVGEKVNDNGSGTTAGSDSVAGTRAVREPARAAGCRHESHRRRAQHPGRTAVGGRGAVDR